MSSSISGGLGGNGAGTKVVKPAGCRTKCPALVEPGFAEVISATSTSQRWTYLLSSEIWSTYHVHYFIDRQNVQISGHKHPNDGTLDGLKQHILEDI